MSLQMAETTIEIQINDPHSEAQRQMVYYPGNVVTFAGRRFGKTDGYVLRMYRSMTLDPGLYWWVGLSWRSASMKRAWRSVSELARRSLRAIGESERSNINKTSHEIRIPGLGEIWFRTADNPSSLAGEGIKGVVIDEFSLMQEIVWVEYLEATLLDYEGWAAFGGVPKGNNWATNLWRAAAGRDGWLQLHATSYDNPFIKKSAIDKIKLNAAERWFNQEYMAQIVDDAGGVFRRVMAAATSTALDKPERGHQYVVGVDWGRENDFTVFSVFDIQERRQVYLDRFTKIDYEFQTSRLRNVYRLFRPSTMVVEFNAMGGPIVERLQSEGLPILGFVTSNVSKEPLIRGLESAFDHGEITILPDPVQVGELQAYEQTRLTNHWRFSAPDGMHDDTVMAMALAWHAIAERPPSWETIQGLGQLDDFKSRWT